METKNALGEIDSHNKKNIVCKGCENYCNVTEFKFHNGNKFYGGNKCERVFSSKGTNAQKGEDVFSYKNKLLFSRAKLERTDSSKLSIGIPRILNMYENFPFWHTLLEQSGVEVILSSPSNTALYEQGLGTVMSDSICFPAKLVHGHIYDLGSKKVDRIFMPMIFHEPESDASYNTYNCPIVTGYSEVIQSSINPLRRWNIPFDYPTISFKTESLLKKGCWEYLSGIKELNLSKKNFDKAFENALTEQKKFKESIRIKGLELIEKSKQTGSPLVVLAGRPYHVDPMINQKTPEILINLGVYVLSEDSIPEENTQHTDHYLSQWAFPARITNAAKWVALQGLQVRLVQINSFACGPDSIVIEETKELLQTVGKNNNLIRVDEISSTGSIRLRLRSIVEFSKYSKANTLQTSSKKRKDNAIFEEKDKDRIILSPLFSGIYSRLFPPLFKLCGYNLVTLPTTSNLTLEEGLKYTNNEICYPAITIIGDLISALKSGQYDRNKIAVGITQTGGQCRASNYLALIKKAMINAGFADIPIISVSMSNGLHHQPGFKIPWLKIMRKFLTSVIIADEFSKMYHSLVFREINKGESLRTLDTYMTKLENQLECKGGIDKLYDILAEGVQAFNAVEVKPGTFPKIGIVGEIYLKYNTYGNLNVIDWLNKQEIEVIQPSLLNFFIQDLVNVSVNKSANIDTLTWKGKLGVNVLTYILNKSLQRSHKICSKFKFYSKYHDIKELAKKAGSFINLAHQYGEGWLIAGELGMFAQDQVYNVISVQPFGCIANQVISKGIEKKIKERYPKMNLLFLDFDAGTSEVNIFNRLYFMIRAAKDSVEGKN